MNRPSLATLPSLMPNITSSPARRTASSPRRGLPARPASQPILLGDNLEGEAREVAAAQAAEATALKAAGKKAVLLSGGELTVTMRGQAAAA